LASNQRYRSIRTN